VEEKKNIGVVLLL